MKHNNTPLNNDEPRLCFVCKIRPSYLWRRTCTSCMLHKLTIEERRARWRKNSAVSYAKKKALRKNGENKTDLGGLS